MMRDKVIELLHPDVVTSGYQFVEAPRVDQRGNLYFSDVLAGGFYRRTWHGELRRFVPERKWIGGIVLQAGGGVLCSGERGVIRVDVETGLVQQVLDEIGGAPIIGVNDIEADASGALFGGTVDFVALVERSESPAPGVFFRLEPDGELRIIRDDVVISNGIAFSPDGRLLYHSESTRGIWVYDVDSSGLPRNPAMFARTPDCDGIAVDSEGAVWVACPEAAEIARYRADATVDRRIHLPFRYVASVTFGGDDLCDLIVATGGALSSGAPREGSIVRLRCDVPGLAGHEARLR